jgi:hypothetical protein|nr:MAG: hypothetical protein [Bacteriophage sp.]
MRTAGNRGLVFFPPSGYNVGVMIALNTPIATIPGRRYCITTVSSVQVIAVIDDEEFDLLGGLPITGQAQFVAPTDHIEVRDASAPEEGAAASASESSPETSSVMFDGSATPLAGDAASVSGSIVEIVRS